MRLLGIDYGDARVGIAISDELGLTAQALEVIDAKRTADVAERIAEIARESGVTRIILGYPLNMNGTAGFRAEKTAAFAARLEAVSGLPVTLVDERLSTAGAERVLISGDVSRKKRRGVVDKVAAALILQTYLDRGGHD
jgi:putative Holliday junction resolvase